jgi:hypothetical protein
MTLKNKPIRAEDAAARLAALGLLQALPLRPKNTLSGVLP